MTRDEAIKLSETTPVYIIVIDHIEYIYKCITLCDYIKLEMASMDDLDMQDMVVMEALLYPDGYQHITISRMLAGTFQQLYINIMKTSGLDHKHWEERISTYRSKFIPTTTDGGNLGFTNPIVPLIIQICKAFPAYKPEEVMAMTVDDILQRAAWADIMLNNFMAPANTQQPNSNTANTEGFQDLNPVDDFQQRGRKWNLSQQELEQMSADASTAALREEMAKHRKG